METETETVAVTEGVLVSGQAEAAHHRVESLGTPGIVYARKDGTWTSCPSLKKTFTVNIQNFRK